MSELQSSGSAGQDSELDHLLVNGECGHTFPVPATKLDGSEFTCPVCGVVDHLDAEGLEAARAELKLRGQHFTLNTYDAKVNKVLSGGQSDEK